MDAKDKGRRRALLGVLAAVVAVIAASALAAGAPSATGFVAAKDCLEHQAFLQGDAGAVAARLPKRYSALQDPATGAPVLFARAVSCQALTADGRTAPAIFASYGIVINSPDDSGCASGAPAVGSTRGDAPPLCNWYTLAWLANDDRVVQLLSSGTPSFPVYKIPGLSFELGDSDPAQGGAPFHAEVPAPSPSRFTMDDVSRARPGTLSVRGSYWNDGPHGTVRVRFSTEDITSGDATGTVKAAAGSELAKLMGAPERPYLQGPYAAIAAEHWDHASYRKQLERANNPGDGFEGSCSVKGTVSFKPGAVIESRDLTYDYPAEGTCTGTLNGKKLTDAPVKLHQGGPALGGCVRAYTTAPGEGTITFADGTVIDYTLDFSFVGTDGDLTVYGTRAGLASGHGTFLTDRTAPAGALACGDPAGVTQVPMDWTFSTQSPVISSPPAADGQLLGERGRAPAMRLTVHPARVRAGQRKRFAFRVTNADGTPVPGATVRLGKRTVHTDQHGRALLATTLRRPGRARARASEPGFAPARATVTVQRALRRAGRRPQFVG